MATGHVIYEPIRLSENDTLGGYGRGTWGGDPRAPWNEAREHPETCGECERYEACDLEGHRGIGWCRDGAGFVRERDAFGCETRRRLP